MARPGNRDRFLALLYPAGLAAGYVLISFAATPTPLMGLWRPMLIATVSAVALAGLLSLVLRRLAPASLAASLAVLGLSAPWLPAVVIGAGGAWFLLVSVMRRSRGQPPPRLSGPQLVRLSGIVAMMFFVVSLGSAVLVIAGIRPSFDRPSNAATGDPPDIVIVLLDGYPRADVLRDGFSYDSEPFERALSDLGFGIASESRSNYSATWATLASLLNGRYLEELEELQPTPRDQAEQYRALSRAIENSSLPKLLRARGYEIAWVPSPFEGAALTTADRVLSGGQITSFELSLLTGGPILSIVQWLAPDFLLAQQRDRIVFGIDQISRLAQPDDGPVFAVVHVLSPHPPMVFRADGSLPPPANCLPECSLWALVDDEQWELFAGQVHHLNELVIDAMRHAVAANPDAIFAVMSDHGTQPPGSPDETVLANLTAVRMPGAEITEDVSPVNLLPQILNASLGTDLPQHPYQGWISAAEYPLSMRTVP